MPAVGQYGRVADPAFTLVQLRYFVAAAECGSMTAAAKQLLVSQSAISTAIAQLERELGVQLFLRHHARGLTMTRAGVAVLREVREFLTHAADLENVARGAGGELVGELYVGCFSTLAPFFLPGLMSAFERANPAITLHVSEQEHAGLKAALRSGECELSVMYGYDLEDDIDRVVVHRLRPYALVSPDHRLAGRKRVRLGELVERDPMILLDLPHTRDYFLGIVTDATGVRPRVRHSTPSFETVRSFVAHGHGFAVLNQLPADDVTYDGGRVVPLQIQDRVRDLEVVIAWMKGTRLSRRAAAFRRTANSEFANAITLHRKN